MAPAPPSRRPAGGFTLAEVAVTIVIVGLALVIMLQGLNTAKVTAAHTRNSKLASELARLTLGRVASGMFQEDIDTDAYLAGSYADEGYPEFSWELITGEEAFGDPEDDRDRFDSFRWDEREDQEEDEEAEKPFEKVKVRVIFPTMRELSNELILEEWIPWKQVYGEEEDR